MSSQPDPAPNEEASWLCPDGLAAFTTLYHRHFASVYRYFYHQIGHVQDAEDLTERTFMTALCRFAQYQPELASLPVWLFGVAHNCLREHRRRRVSAGPLPLEILDSQPLPESQLIAAERAEALHGAIRRLPAAQRDALALRYFGELRTSEVAAVLGKTPDAVKMLVHRAVKGLRDRLTMEDWQ
jgi:RNA polymerase sigma-70 factor (ECF subfamily)